jgi:Arm DNA-binding domain
MRLNDTIIRNTKPGPALQKLSDGDGLYLFVQPNGARWWRMRYFVNGVEKMLLLAGNNVTLQPTSKEELDSLRSMVARSLSDVAATGL